MYGSYHCTIPSATLRPSPPWTRAVFQQRVVKLFFALSPSFSPYQRIVILDEHVSLSNGTEHIRRTRPYAASKQEGKRDTPLHINCSARWFKISAVSSTILRNMESDRMRRMVAQFNLVVLAVTESFAANTRRSKLFKTYTSTKSILQIVNTICDTKRQFTARTKKSLKLEYNSNRRLHNRMLCLCRGYFCLFVRHRLFQILRVSLHRKLSS